MFFLLPELAGGGAERLLLEACRHWPPDLETPTLIVAKRRGALLDSVPDNLPVIYLGGPRANFSWCCWRLRRLLQRRQPRLVVSHLAFSDALLLTAQLGLKRSWRSVCWLHGHPEISGGRLEALLLRLVYDRADAYVAVSKALASAFVRHYAVDPRRLKVQGLPHPFEALQALALTVEPPRWPAPGRRLLWVGRFDPVKRPDRLLLALSQVPRELPWSLVMLGSGPLEVEMRNLSERLGLSARVHFVGFQANPYPYFAACQWVLSTSDSEALPGAILEALAFGRPVLATEGRGGSAEVLGQGQFGRLLPPQVEALSTALTEWLLDPQEPDALAQRARLGAEPYGWTESAPAFFRLLASFLE